MRNNAGRSEPRVTLLISNFMRRFDTKTRLRNGFSAMRGGYGAPLWVPVLAGIDSADVSGFYKRQRAACGSRCLTHLRAPAAALFVFSFPFFFPLSRTRRRNPLETSHRNHFGCCLDMCVFLPVLPRGVRGFSVSV